MFRNRYVPAAAWGAGMRGWGYQDFTSALGNQISNTSVTISANENGSLIAGFSATNIISPTAVICTLDSNGDPNWKKPRSDTGALAYFTKVVRVAAHSGASVTLNLAPHSSFDCRIYYFYNYQYGSPASYTLPSKAVASELFAELQDLMITEEEFETELADGSKDAVFNTLENTPIGQTTPAAGTFTTLDVGDIISDSLAASGTVTAEQLTSTDDITAADDITAGEKITGKRLTSTSMAILGDITLGWREGEPSISANSDIAFRGGTAGGLRLSSTGTRTTLQTFDGSRDDLILLADDWLYLQGRGATIRTEDEFYIQTNDDTDDYIVFSTSANNCIIDTNEGSYANLRIRADRRMHLESEEGLYLDPAGSILLRPSGDLDNYIRIRTTSASSEIFFSTAFDGEPFYITSNSGEINFDNENLTTSGTITAGGLTLDTNELITLGGGTIKHDGTDFVFDDNIATVGKVDANLGFRLPSAFYDDDMKITLSTRLTFDDITIAASVGDVLTQATTSASMVVTHSSTATEYVYGVMTTATGFNKTNTVSGGDLVANSMVPTDVENGIIRLAGPHSAGSPDYENALEIFIDRVGKTYGPTLRGASSRSTTERVYLSGSWIFLDDQSMLWGSGIETGIKFRTLGATEAEHYQEFFVSSGATNSRNFVFKFGSSAHANPLDDPVPQATDPTIRVQSGSSTTAHCVKFHHDQTDGWAEAETGALKLKGASGVAVSGSIFNLANIPTADPSVSGEVYTDSGFLRMSP